MQHVVCKKPERTVVVLSAGQIKASELKRNQTARKRYNSNQIGYAVGYAIGN